MGRALTGVELLFSLQTFMEYPWQVQHGPPRGLEQQKDKSSAFEELYPLEQNDAWGTRRIRVGPHNRHQELQWQAEVICGWAEESVGGGSGVQEGSKPTAGKLLEKCGRGHEEVRHAGMSHRSMRTCRGVEGAGQGWGGWELHEPTHFIRSHWRF